tara:strand:- start:682 stop:1035 length:354 start_codon:yes stop_codon:yes gene_type:complete
MEIRGRIYQAAQGIVLVDTAAENKEVIAGVTGKTLFLNYLEISISDTGSSDTFALTDGSGGTAFWDIDYYSSPYYQARAYSVNFGKYGFALTEGNGLFGITNDSSFQLTVVALGYYK